MKYKRCLLLMLILCTVLSMLPAEASATDTSVEQQIIDACTYGETVDISQFRLTATKLEALYQDLLLRCGIPCLQVESDPMDHVWNMVQLGGHWYHLDVTWDDPTPDTKGLERHEYFLRTDSRMSAGENPHQDWEIDITCTDTAFSNRGYSHRGL